MLALPPGYASPIFIPAGIAIAAVFIGGNRFLPWVLLGSLILNIWVGYSSSHQINTFGIAIAFVIAIASTLQAGLGGWVLRKAIGYPAPFNRSSEILKFLMLSPLFCLTSATLSVISLWLLAVFDTASLASNWAAWWVGDTLGVLVAFPLVMIFAGEPRGLWRSRILSVTVPMLLIFSIFVAIFFRTNQWEYNDSLSDFRQLSQQALNQVHTKLEEQEFLLEQTVGLFKHDIHGKVTGAEFHRFVQPALNRFSMIQALEWAPEVDSKHRDAFESEMRHVFPKFEIRERDATGSLQRTGNRETYYPVTFVEPLAANEPAVGFDLASNPIRLEAIKRSRLTGNVAITAGVKLVQEQQQQTGVLLILVVNPKDNNSAVVLTVLRVGDFMDKLLADLHPILYTRLIDLGAQKAIYDNFEQKSQQAIYEHDFEFGGRLYRLETAPTSAYLKQHQGWQSWGVLAVGVLGTGLLGALLLLGTGYTARMEMQVKDRTRELEKESLKSKTLLRNSSDGIHILDTQGNIIEASESFCTMLGYRHEEIIGMNVSEWDARSLDSAELLAEVRRQFENPGRSLFETRHKRKDGTIFDVEVSGMPLVLDGQPALFNSSRDITERNQTINALRRSNDIFKAIQLSITESIFLLDITWVVLAVNPTAAQRLGKKSNEIIGRDVFSFFPPDVACKRRAVAEEVFRTLKPKSIDDDRNGKVFSTSYYPVINTMGKCEAVVVVGTDITERKRIENALREKEERLALATLHNGVGIWDWNLITQQMIWDDSMYALYHIRREDFIGTEEAWRASLHPDDLERGDQEVEAAIRGEKPFDTEFRVIWPNGEIHFIKAVAKVFLDDQGKPLRMLGTNVDITARKRADAEQNRLLKIIEEATDFIAMSDMQGHLTYLNKAGARLVGLPDDVDLSHLEIKDFHPEWATKKVLEEGVPTVLRQGFWQDETALLHKNGHETPVLQLLMLHRDEFGNPQSLSTIIRDITERKQAEIELSVAATAFESQEGIIVTDASGVILRVNRAFSDITGYTSEEVIGKNTRMLKSGSHDANFYAAMWNSINNTGGWEGEIWNRRKSGDVYPEHLTITAVKNAEGKVTNYVATIIDITLTKAAEDEIKHLAFYDPLTHLPNRRLLLDRLSQALASVARSGRTGALLFIDLDNFKILNDTLGHDIGDILLQQVGNRLESCVREGDTVARLGGDEFVVMLEDLNKDSIEAAGQTEFVGNKILSTLNQPYQLASHEYRNTPSIGATLFSDNSLSVDDLMKQADIAMYQSKKAGRNTIRFFDPKMQETIDTRATIERELHDALEKQQFQLYYQLQVGGIQADGTLRPIGAEVLIRWIHPEQGVISPAHFIPLAEESGLILPIGQWVLDTACAQIKAWEKDGITQDFVLAVNVSSNQFIQPNFVSQVKETVKRHAINPNRLKLELTESLLLNDIEGTISIMNELNDLGIQFSLDDFGTGYSSLQYLKRLPLDQIKIDQSFVRDIVFDLNDRAIVKTIIAMARSLNLNYIAEGVETEEQRQLLFDMGCSFYQGYLFSKPMPLEQFEALIQKT